MSTKGQKLTVPTLDIFINDIVDSHLKIKGKIALLSIFAHFIIKVNCEYRQNMRRDACA